MARSLPLSNVFYFIWWEIVLISECGTKSLLYAPYIMFMIEKVSRIEFICDTIHSSYKLQLTHKQKSAAPSSSVASSSSVAGPSYSKSRQYKGKSTSHKARTLKGIFCMCQDNTTQIRE